MQEWLSWFVRLADSRTRLVRNSILRVVRVACARGRVGCGLRARSRSADRNGARWPDGESRRPDGGDGRELDCNRTGSRRATPVGLPLPTGAAGFSWTGTPLSPAGGRVSVRPSREIEFRATDRAARAMAGRRHAAPFSRQSEGTAQDRGRECELPGGTEVFRNQPVKGRRITPYPGRSGSPGWECAASV